MVFCIVIGMVHPAKIRKTAEIKSVTFFGLKGLSKECHHSPEPSIDGRQIPPGRRLQKTGPCLL